MKNILTFLFLVLLISSCSNQNTSDENRYEFVISSQGSQHVIDKKTGTVWSKNEWKWENEGTLPKHAPNKGDIIKK